MMISGWCDFIFFKKSVYVFLDDVCLSWVCVCNFDRCRCLIVFFKSILDIVFVMLIGGCFVIGVSVEVVWVLCLSLVMVGDVLKFDVDSMVFVLFVIILIGFYG